MMLLKTGATFLMLTIQLGCCTLAFAFDNIEAYAAYNGSIKREIMTEFLDSTNKMKAKNERLGMTVRDKDMNILRQNMYDKAVLMGRCVDKATTIRKKSSTKNSVEKDTSECIDSHIKFIFRQPAIPVRCADIKVWEPPYDFLLFESISSATDYLAIKECYDRLAAKDKLGQALGLGWQRLTR